MNSCDPGRPDPGRRQAHDQIVELQGKLTTLEAEAAALRQKVELLCNAYPDAIPGNCMEKMLATIRNSNGFASEDYLWKLRYELLSLASGQVCYEYDPASDTINWSGSIKNVLGYDMSEMAGGFQRWVELIHPEDRQNALEHFEKARREGSLYEAEYRFLHKQGFFSWIHERGFFATNASGQTRMIGVMTDVSDKKNAEKNLEERESRLHSIVRTAPVGIGIGVGRVIVEANDYLAQLFGYTREEMIGRNTRFLYPSETDYLAAIKGIASLHYPVTGDTQWLHKNGSLVDINVSASLIDTQDVSKGIVFAVMDLRDRKQSEQALRDSEERHRVLFESATDAVLLVKDCKLVACNRKAEEIFGTAADKLIGMPAGSSSPLNQPDGQNSLEKARNLLALAEEGNPQRFEWLHMRPDGTCFEVDINLSRVELGGEYYVFAIIRDITQRKQAENALRQNEAALRSLFRAVPVGITILQDRILKSVNERLCEITGRIPEQLVNKSSRQLYESDEEFERVGQALYGKILENGSSYVETRFFRPDGSWRHVSLYAAPLKTKDLSGGAAVAIQDITEAKIAQEALRERESRLSSVLRTVPVGIGVTRNRILIEVNEHLCIMFGRSRDELLGQSVLECYASQSEYERAGRELYQSDLVTVGDYLLRRRDGSTFQAHICSTPLDLEDPQSGRTIAVIDMTERLAAEEQLRQQAALLSVSHDSLIVWDIQQGIQYLNRATEELTGILFKDVQGRELRHLFKTHSPLDIRAATKQVFETGAWKGELKLAGPEEREVVVDSRWTLIRNADQSPRAVFITCNDITEKKRFEAQFLRAQRLESVGTLASGVAHDLNNILSPIMMGIEIIQDYPVDADVQRILQMMKDSAHRGTETIRQLLTFARGTDTQKGPVQPRHILREILRLVQTTFPKNIQIFCDYTGDIHPVLADPSHLHQVLMNLCVNARDAMPEGGILLLSLENVLLDETSSGIHPKAHPGPYVIYKVADNGIGIPKEIIDRIFDPFFTTKSQGKGSGLGLSTVIGIAENHGGFVMVESKPGAGSTFSVYLPAACTADVASSDDEQPASISGNNRVVLVVDDEPAVRLMIERALSRNGFVILTASSGIEAFELYKANRDRIRLALTDVMMPCGDGRQLIVHIKELDPTLPIVAMSGLASQESKSSILGLGACYFLPKPFKTETLLNALAEAMEKPAGS